METEAEVETKFLVIPFGCFLLTNQAYASVQEDLPRGKAIR